jgi:hypothetical protein
VIVNSNHAIQSLPSQQKAHLLNLQTIWPALYTTYREKLSNLNLKTSTLRELAQKEKLEDKDLSDAVVRRGEDLLINIL